MGFKNEVNLYVEAVVIGPIDVSNFSQDNTILDIKKAYQEKLDCPIEKQSVLLRGAALSDTKTLREAGIDSE